MRPKLIAHRFKRKTPEEDNTEIYHGLADAFGLESLMRYDEKAGATVDYASVCLSSPALHVFSSQS